MDRQLRWLWLILADLFLSLYLVARILSGPNQVTWAFLVLLLLTVPVCLCLFSNSRRVWVLILIALSSLAGVLLLEGLVRTFEGT